MGESLQDSIEEQSIVDIEKRSLNQELWELIDTVEASLNYLKEKGITDLPCSKDCQRIIETWGKAVTVRHNGSTPVQSYTDPRDEWKRLKEEILTCKKCRLGDTDVAKPIEDSSMRVRMAFIAPFPQPGFMNAPFSGSTGELLLKIVQAMHVSPDEVVVLNIVKCQPIGRLSPFSEETLRCASYLKRQLAIIRPECICTLGVFATQALLGTEEKFETLRGRFHLFDGLSVMPTHHPETLLKEFAKKRETWEDVKKIMEKLGV